MDHLNFFIKNTAHVTLQDDEDDDDDDVEEEDEEEDEKEILKAIEWLILRRSK